MVNQRCSTVQRTVTNYVPEQKCNDVQTDVFVTVPWPSCTKVSSGFEPASVGSSGVGQRAKFDSIICKISYDLRGSITC